MLPIIMAIENGDDRDFVAKLYSKYEKQLYKVAYGVLSNPANAEDCIHDTICSVIEQIEKFKTFDEPRQIKYMCVCCRNAALNKYNKMDNTVSLTIETEHFEEKAVLDVEDPTANLYEVVLNNELKNKLRDCINSLDRKYRDVIIFKFEYGFDTKEIAGALYISESLVRQRLKRAKELLRRLGGKELYGLFKG